MVTAVLPARRALRLRQRAKQAASKALGLLRPARPVAVNLLASPLTVAGLACADIGVFTASVTAGWIITGLSLFVLEHVIADEQ